MSSTNEPMRVPDILALTATAKTYIDVFRTLDTEALSRILSDEYSHQFAPTSAHIPGSMDHNGFVARFRRVREVISSFTVIVKQMWPNPSLRQVLSYGRAPRPTSTGI
ncbi:hypothetical protein J7337_007473 [Fusarium musae]|uniref:SnoaL-like domain-containing protein n=1 Tax=Fusarium musae TaxID=1042133 RepID=A0A9P8DGZ1_9HYPO|nr:hypothetical protein J7337_007473 [Fusarium musae]KAG9501782.1 hypothetical protein J7337_007473 [Fusarium musae]